MRRRRYDDYYGDDYYQPRYRRPRRRRGFSCFSITLSLVGILAALAFFYFLYVLLTPYLPIIRTILFVILIIAALSGIIWLALFLYGMLQEQLQKRDNRDFVKVQQNEKVVVRQRQTKDLRYLAQEEARSHYQEPQQPQIYLPKVYETPTDPMLQAVKPVEPEKPTDTVIHFANVYASVRTGHVLFGMDPDTRQLEIIEWSDARTVLVLGETATGKTSTMAAIIAQVVANGMLIVPCDAHAHKKDSLFRRIVPLRSALFPGASFAVNHPDILYNAELVREELLYRKSGGQYSREVMLVIDEWNEDEELLKILTEIAQLIGREGRGFGVYLMIGAQEIVGQIELRKSLVARIVHRCDQSEAGKVLPSRYAKLAPELPNGMTFVKVNGQTKLLQQPLITRLDIQTIASEYLDVSFDARPDPFSPKRTKQFTSDLDEQPREFPRNNPAFQRNGQAFQNSVSAFSPSFSTQKQRFEAPQQYIETETFRLGYRETPRLPPVRPQRSKQDGNTLLRNEVIRLARAGMPRRQIAVKLGLQGAKYEILKKILSEAGL